MILFHQDEQRVELRKMPFTWWAVIAYIVVPVLVTFVHNIQSGVLATIFLSFLLLAKAVADGVQVYAFVEIDKKESKLTLKKRVLGLLIQEQIFEDISIEDIKFPKYKISGKGIQFHLEYHGEEKMDLWRFKSDEEKEKVESFLN